MGLRDKARYLKMGLRNKANYLVQENEQSQTVDEIQIKDALDLNEMNLSIILNNIDKLILFFKQLNTLEKETISSGNLLNKEDLQGILKKILQNLLNIFGVKMASFLLKNRQENYIISESLGLNEESRAKFLLSNTNEFLKDLIENHNFIFLDNYKKNPDIMKNLSSLDLSASEFFLALPLVVSGKLFGILNILKIKDNVLTTSSEHEIKLFFIISMYLSKFLQFLLSSNSFQESELDLLLA